LSTGSTNELFSLASQESRFSLEPLNKVVNYKTVSLAFYLNQFLEGFSSPKKNILYKEQKTK
jgi:hypothetical protein